MPGDVVDVGFLTTKKEKILEHPAQIIDIGQLLKREFKLFFIQTFSDLPKNLLKAEKNVKFSFDKKYFDFHQSYSVVKGSYSLVSVP